MSLLLLSIFEWIGLIGNIWRLDECRPREAQKRNNPSTRTKYRRLGLEQLPSDNLTVHNVCRSFKNFNMNVTAMTDQQLLFGWVDYFVFSVTLLVSLLIGVYHAWRGANSTSEYLLGGKSMGVFPIAMSLAARLLTHFRSVPNSNSYRCFFFIIWVKSSISGTTLLGTPSDIYLNGTMFFWFGLAMLLCTPATSYIYLPIFHRLQVVSANQVGLKISQPHKPMNQFCLKYLNAVFLIVSWNAI